MTADDFKRLEIEGHFAQGYKIYAWDADAEEYMPVTGYVVSADGLRVELQTDEIEQECPHCSEWYTEFHMCSDTQESND